MIEVELRGRIPRPTAAFDAAHLLAERLMEQHVAMMARVEVHSSRRHMLTWRISTVDIHVRAHWALLPHPDELLAVLGGDDSAWPALRDRVPPKPLPHLEQAGRVHQLDAILVEEQARVPDAGPVAITWGRWPGRAARTVVRLGSFAHAQRLIRIHPVLDHASVPRWFVSAIVHHELLHAAVPVDESGTRRRIHPPEFRRREALHPDHIRAEHWQRDHFHELAERCRARVGKP